MTRVPVSLPARSAFAELVSSRCCVVAQVKQQIEEIDRLTHIVSSIEREMLSLKRQYEVRFTPMITEWHVLANVSLPSSVTGWLALCIVPLYRWPLRSGTTPAFSSLTATTSCAFCMRSRTCTSRH
jgi:hypothetical protein